MTPEQITKARKIIDAATPGPWENCYSDNLCGPYNRICEMPCGGPDIFAIGTPNIPDDTVNSKFIAAARNKGGWEDALDEIERLNTIIEVAKKVAIGNGFSGEVVGDDMENLREILNVRP